MEAAVPMRSLPRQIAAVSVVIALALAGYGCGASIQRGMVLFSTDIPTANSGCRPENTVTSVSAGTSVYATYVFKAKPGGETVSIEITKNGESYYPRQELDTSETQGLDCFSDPTDLSTLPDWGVGTYKVTLTALDATVAEGELTVT
jgi:hypothetical protein